MFFTQSSTSPQLRPTHQLEPAQLWNITPPFPRQSIWEWIQKVCEKLETPFRFKTTLVFIAPFILYVKPFCLLPPLQPSTHPFNTLSVQIFMILAWPPKTDRTPHIYSLDVKGAFALPQSVFSSPSVLTHSRMWAGTVAKQTQHSKPSIQSRPSLPIACVRQSPLRKNWQALLRIQLRDICLPHLLPAHQTHQFLLSILNCTTFSEAPPSLLKDGWYKLQFMATALSVQVPVPDPLSTAHTSQSSSHITFPTLEHSRDQNGEAQALSSTSTP